MSDIETWSSGYNSGTKVVLEFLKEVKNIDFEEEFDAWSNCDYYTNWKGEKIDKCIPNSVPIEKKFGVDFNSRGGALTLDVSEVTEGNEESGIYEREHKDGWTIKGEIHEDYFTWVNDFEAKHNKFGKVWGNFEDIVYADSEEAFKDFYANHEPSEWDYGDI